jgi:hypothetical protein
MSDQNFGERYNSSGAVERNNPVTNTLVSPDPSTGGEGLEAESALETLLDRINDTVSPMDVTAVQENPMRAVTLNPLPVVETVVAESRADKQSSYTPPVVTPALQKAPTLPVSGSLAALLDREESEHFRTRWNEIQGKFVDEPRTAVQQADGLVSEVVDRITRLFAQEHSSLESQWNLGSDVSTEDLRKALQHYRSFFNRLVV